MSASFNPELLVSVYTGIRVKQQSLSCDFLPHLLQKGIESDFHIECMLNRLLASIINFGFSYAVAWVNHRQFNLSALRDYIKSVSSQLSILYLFQIARFNRRYMNLTDVAAARQYYSHQRQITKSLIIVLHYTCGLYLNGYIHVVIIP